jgi:hypothetical protein
MTARKPRSRRDWSSLMAQLDAKANAIAEQRKRLEAERKENGQ